MSFSCGRVVQFFIVGPLHRKRSEGADDEEQTTIRSPRERSELGQTPTKTLQPQCQPQAGARLPPTKTQNENPQTKTTNQNENLKRKPFSFSLLVLVFVLRFRLWFSFWFSRLRAGAEARPARRACCCNRRPGR